MIFKYFYSSKSVSNTPSGVRIVSTPRLNSSSITVIWYSKISYIFDKILNGRDEDTAPYTYMLNECISKEKVVTVTRKYLIRLMF